MPESLSPEEDLRFESDFKIIHGHITNGLNNLTKNQNKNSNVNKLIILLCIMIACSLNIIQAQTIKADLSAKNFTAVNRAITIADNEGKTNVHLDAKPNDGVAWLNNTSFATGIIELDVKGKDVMQQSFVGIAFHGISDSTYDAIYFRPFNFGSDDAVRKSHSVQYISMPQYDWSYLRERFPSRYENALTKTVEANQWFHAKIVVSNEQIEVFINNDDKASLVVKPLSKTTTGKIGFWVGNNSDGDFANLTITK